MMHLSRSGVTAPKQTEHFLPSKYLFPTQGLHVPAFKSPIQVQSFLASIVKPSMQVSQVAFVFNLLEVHFPQYLEQQSALSVLLTKPGSHLQTPLSSV
jgi:hypothetical protein